MIPFLELIKLSNDHYDSGRTRSLKKSSQENRKQKEQKTKKIQSIDYATIKEYVSEINSVMEVLDYNLTVVLEQNENGFTIKIINTKNQNTLRYVLVQEVINLAQNLRNHKMTLIDKDV